MRSIRLIVRFNKGLRERIPARTVKETPLALVVLFAAVFVYLPLASSNLGGEVFRISVMVTDSVMILLLPALWR
ncbi:unnamed protein product [Chrysoparadoxa australica]